MSTPAMGKMSRKLQKLRELTGNTWNGKTGEAETDRLELRQERLQKKMLAEDSWRLFRECTALMEENIEKWLERSEAEKKRNIEDEKQERLSTAGHKRSQLEKKIQEEADKKPKKKETKENASRRLEEKRRGEGKQKIKSGLWKKRR